MLYYFTQPKAQIKTANKVVGNLIFEMRAALENVPQALCHFSLSNDKSRCFCSWGCCLLCFHARGFCCFDMNGLLNQAGIDVSGFKWRFLLLVFWASPSARTRSSKSIPMTLVGHAHFLLVLPLELLLLLVDVLVLLAQTPKASVACALPSFVFSLLKAMQDVTSDPETMIKMHCTLASLRCGGHFSLLKSKSEEKGGGVGRGHCGTGLNEQSSQERGGGGVQQCDGAKE